MLVDVHAHLMLEGHEGQLYSLADMFRGSGREKLAQFVEYFRRAGIDRVILCSDPDLFIPKNDGGDPAGSLKRANDTVAEACARYPDLFAGSVMVNPLALDAGLWRDGTHLRYPSRLPLELGSSHAFHRRAR